MGIILTFNGDPNNDVLNAGRLLAADDDCLFTNVSLKRLENVWLAAPTFTEIKSVPIIRKH